MTVCRVLSLSMRYTFLAAAALVLLGGVARAEAEEILLATETESTKVTTYEGVSAWSSYDGRRYVLRLYRAGQVTTAAVPASAQAFDVDLGPDEQGRVTAVYSRCDVLHDGEGLPHNCRLYRYTPGGRERRIKGVSRPGYSEHIPTIWRSRIAFARYRVLGQGTVVDRIYLSDSRGVRELPRGTLRRGIDPPDTDAYLGTIDLRGDRLAFAWGFVPTQCTAPGTDLRVAFPIASELWLVDVRTRAARRLDQGCSDDNNGLGSASLYGGGLSYVVGTFRRGPLVETFIKLPGGQRTTTPLDAHTLSVARYGTTRIREQQIDATDTTSGRYQIWLSE